MNANAQAAYYCVLQATKSAFPLCLSARERQKWAFIAKIDGFSEELSVPGSLHYWLQHWSNIFAAALPPHLHELSYPLRVVWFP
jgi:hypothetical protein